MNALAAPHLEVPSSIGATMLAVQAVMFVLAYSGPKLRSARNVAKSVERLQTTCRVMVDDWQDAVVAVERVKGIFEEPDDGKRNKLDQISDARAALSACLEAYKRGAASTDSVNRSLHDLRQHDAILQFASRGWRKVAAEGETALKTLYDELARVDLEPKLVESIALADTAFDAGQRLAAEGGLPYEEHEETARIAAAGFNAWLAGLPHDDWSDAIDSEQEHPLKWTDEGWVESG